MKDYLKLFVVALALSLMALLCIAAVSTSPSAGGSGSGAIQIKTNSVAVGVQTNLNFIWGAGTTASLATNNTGANQVDVRIIVDGGNATNAQPPSATLTNLSNTSAITNVEAGFGLKTTDILYAPVTLLTTNLNTSGNSTSTTHRAVGGTTHAAGVTNTVHERNTGWLENGAGATNIGGTATHQAAPLLVLGGLIFPPTTNTTLTVNVTTNVVQRYVTNDSFTVTFTGAAPDGARGELQVWNTAATDKTLTWPVSWSESTGAGITTITLVSNSITRVLWRIESGSNYVSVSQKDAYQLTFSSPGVGQILKIHCLSCGPGGSMVLTNADDATGAAGTVVRFQTNTTTVGSQTNLNVILTNGHGLAVLATNNSGTGSADYHFFLENAGIPSTKLKDPTGSGGPALSNAPSIFNLTSLGVLKLADGLDAAPSLSFTSDPDTGLFRAGANQLYLTAGGISKLGVSASQVSAFTNTSIAGSLVLDSAGAGSAFMRIHAGNGLEPGRIFLSDTNFDAGIRYVGILAPQILASNFSLVIPSNAPPNATDQYLKIIALSGTNAIIGYGTPPGASGDAAMVNEVAVSDSFSLTNLTATASTPGGTFALTAGADPDPDKVTFTPSVASATVAGAVTAQGQVLAGLKELAGGIATLAAYITNYASANDITNRSLTSTLIKGDSNGKHVAAVAGTDYVAPSTVISDSITLPMGSWRTNDMNVGSLTPASALNFTNTADTFEFANSVTNGIRQLLSLPVGWDAGVIRMQVTALCTGTNHTSATNLVFGVRAAALKIAADWTNPTFGTQIAVTNHIHIDANKPGEAITRDITIGNSPAATNSVLLEIVRLGADTGDTMTNSSVRLVDSKLFFKRTLNGSWPEPSP